MYSFICFFGLVMLGGQVPPVRREGSEANRQACFKPCGDTQKKCSNWWVGRPVSPSPRWLTLTAEITGVYPRDHFLISMPGPLPFEEGRSVTKLPPWARSLFMEIEISGDVSCHSLSLNVAHEHLTLAEKGVGVGVGGAADRDSGRDLKCLWGLIKRGLGFTQEQREFWFDLYMTRMYGLLSDSLWIYN